MSKRLEILIAEDEEDQQILISEAFKASHGDSILHFVKDGVELLTFLRAEGAHVDRAGKPLPGLILLDLNMPRVDGRSALAQIKRDPVWRLIPVIVMTTSNAKDDIHTSYAMGANAYITKPVDFASFVDVIASINHYWSRVATLPIMDLIGEN